MNKFIISLLLLSIQLVQSSQQPTQASFNQSEQSKPGTPPNQKQTFSSAVNNKYLRLAQQHSKSQKDK